MIFLNVDLTNSIENYVVWCKSSIEADFWRIKFIEKFAGDVIWVDRWKRQVGFTDSTWHFHSEHEGRKAISTIRNNVTELPQEAIYIIIDDPERKRLDTYEGI